MGKGIINPRGTADILPENIAAWQGMESISREILERYGYREIRTPNFEDTQLFCRSVGQTSDIVQKQMLNLASSGSGSDADDIGQATLSLRPEGTAAIVRSYIQNHLDRKEKLSKFYYIGPMFRGERPQKGRLRQFHQIGIEAIGPGTASPYLDAEVMALSVSLLKAFGVKDFELKINTLGTGEDKEKFSQALKSALEEKTNELCLDCQNRIQRNVLRVLDCKQKQCRQCVDSLNLGRQYLSQESSDYYRDVKACLDNLGVSYSEDICLVRGLDYYTQTVFELSCAKLGAQDALGAGGRYNNLISQLGGPDADAVGFALGMERVLLVSDLVGQPAKRLDAYAVVFTEVARPRMFRVVNDLRQAGVCVDINYAGGSGKSQMRQADKSGAKYVLMIGEEELSNGTISVKDMGAGIQETISLGFFDELAQKLKG